MDIKKFYDDHAEVNLIVKRIDGVLNSAVPTTQVEHLIETVQELFGRYSIHLALEDAALYPRLVEHSDAAIRETALRFQTEMGGIKAQFDAYKRKWPGKTSAKQNPQEFVAETRKIIAALKDRISREDGTLYPMVKRA